MKDFLEKLISGKEERAEQLKESIKTAESADEVRSLGDELNAVQTEIRDAQEKLAELEKKEEKRGFNPMATFGATTVKNEETEKRAKALVETGKMSIAAKETRSILLDTGAIAKPTQVGGINDAQNVVSTIVDQVKVVDCTGMGAYNEAYQKSIQDAEIGADGVAPAGSDPVFRYAAIKPVTVKTLTYVSNQIKKQTPLQYEEKIKAGAMSALRAKIGKMIATGNGTTEIFGIINAVNTEEVPEAIYETLNVESAVIDEKTLRNIVMAYGGDENIGANATLYLNKKDLIAFGDVRGTNEKQAVYEITPDGSNPNTGIIKDGGLSVPYCINSACKALTGSTKGSAPIKTMMYGDSMNYELGLFGDYEVVADESYKFAEGLITVKGEVMVGGNLTVDKGFVVVTLGAN